MNNPSIRAVVSIALVAIGAVVYLHNPETPFVVTETPAVQPVKPVEPPKPSPKPAPAPIGEPAEIVCTFRCANCRRAPTLTYHEGDALPLWATCKNCGRSMPRTDPKLNAAEQRQLAPPKTSWRPVPQAAFCRT